MRPRPRGQGTLFPRRFSSRSASPGSRSGWRRAAYVVGRELEPEAAQTMAFATIALAELLLVFSIRSGMSPAWRGPRNPVLVASVLVSLLLLVLTIYLAPLRDAFGTDALGGAAVAIVVGLAIAPAALAEAAKAVLGSRRRRSGSSATSGA